MPDPPVPYSFREFVRQKGYRWYHWALLICAPPVLVWVYEVWVRCG